MDTGSQKDRSHGRKVIFAISCASLFFIIVFLSFMIYILINRENIPYVQNYFPTPVFPTPSATAAVQPPSDATVTKEDFSNNLNNWSTFFFFSKAEVKNGKLFLESFEQGEVALAYCHTCSFELNNYLTNPYYLQADFSTNKATKQYYGLVFNFFSADESYYAFQINVWTKNYGLDKHTTEGWIHLLDGSSNSIKPYPETNTLSIDFGQNTITLYINGEKLETYEDENPTHLGKIGVIVDNAGFQLIVDNLIAYQK